MTEIRATTGFTLVEISIVMIIIGLLIGGTFGGMKLVENMRIHRTIQDLKSIESAALTFKDTYGRLPGDIRNPSSRLPNCTVAPCAIGGNGNRTIDGGAITGPTTVVTLTDVSEVFLFWHHLQAADLLSVGVENSTDMNFGKGQPRAPFGGGYRLGGSVDWTWSGYVSKPTQIIAVTKSPIGSYANEIDDWRSNICKISWNIDNKMDDGLPYFGSVNAYACGSGPLVPSAKYHIMAQRGDFIYAFKF